MVNCPQLDEDTDTIIFSINFDGNHWLVGKATCFGDRLLITTYNSLKNNGTNSSII